MSDLRYIVIASGLIFLAACMESKTLIRGNTSPVTPIAVSDTVFSDSDDPAIWIHPRQKDSSLIIGTDKDEINGGLYVYDLSGKKDAHTVTGLKRMNNVDVAYGLKLFGRSVDIVVATERNRNSIRVFSLPDMKEIDGGGLEVFVGDAERAPMGLALYTRPADQAIFAIVSRKSGPADDYLHQYLLSDNGNGHVTAKLVRTFGQYSHKQEIESIAVDNELGYVYYSDEQFGIRKYYADPAKGNAELAVFGRREFKEDNEGISIYKFKDGTGYLLVSDQSANKFNVYPREGDPGNMHSHSLITKIAVSTNQSDGCDVTSVSLPGFPGGLFVAMSDDKTFQFYRWKDIAKAGGLRENMGEIQ